MRLGGPILGSFANPEEWVKALKDLSYTAGYCPIEPDVSSDEISAYVSAAAEANLVIAEVGAWSNPMSPDDEVRTAALKKNIAGLTMAEEIGARCCVNIAGSRGNEWASPDPIDLADDTFDMVVELVRRIIDEVKPTRSYYTIEPMPFMYPDGPDSYLRLLDAIDRERFAVHMDPVNMVSSPQRYAGSGDFIRECFQKLGPHIKSCHAKDITHLSGYPVQLQEVQPGLGSLDYSAFMQEVGKLDADMPVMLEHLETAEEYAQAAEYVRSAAAKEGLTLI